MSLRDFNATTEERPTTLNHEPNGNGSGLGEFHTVSPEEIKPNNTGKIVGALAVALMVGAAGVYAYSMSGHAANPTPMQQTASLPKAPPPVAPPAMTMPAPEATALDAAAPAAPLASAPVTTPAERPAPVKSAAVKQAAPVSDSASVRMNADSRSISTSQQAVATPVTPAPVQQQAAMPEPASPAPNPSDVANANPQSSVSVPQGATTAQDIPAPALTPEQPAQQPEAASPASDQPAQSAGQVAQ